MVRWRNKQAVPFFFFSPFFFHDLVILWGFALWHAIPRKIRMWNRTFCGRWQDQRRQRWKKAVERILRSQPLFLLSPGVHYSAYLCCQSCPSGSSFPKTVPSTVPCEWGLPVGLFFLASDGVQCGSALAVVSPDLAGCRERRVGCHFDVRAVVAHPGAASSSPCARGEVTCLGGSIVSSGGSQSFLRSRVGMGGQPERVGAPNTSAQHQSISHWAKRWNVRHIFILSGELCVESLAPVGKGQIASPVLLGQLRWTFPCWWE